MAKQKHKVGDVVIVNEEAVTIEEYDLEDNTYYVIFNKPAGRWVTFDEIDTK